MRKHLLDTGTLPLRHEVEIAGTTCAVRTNSPDLVATLAARWPAPSLSGARSFGLAAVIDDDLSRVPVTDTAFRGRGQFVFATFRDGGFFAFDLLRLQITACVSATTARDPQFWNSVLIPIAIGVLGPSLGVVPLHCACLESYGGGMLVAGVSGAGKSTLAVALAKEGMSLVSDDWTYASFQDSQVIAHGLGVPVKLLPDTVRYFDELHLQHLVISMNGELAFEIDPCSALAVSVATTCRPDCLVFLQRDNADAITPLSNAIAREFFLRSAEPLPPELVRADRQRRSTVDAITDRDCWLFRYSGTPQQGAAVLREFFEETYNVHRRLASASRTA